MCHLQQHRRKQIVTLSGIMFCNGPAGRCGEWRHLTVEHFDAQMAKGVDFIVCSTHKTSLVYGDVFQMAGAWHRRCDDMLQRPVP